MWIERIDAGLRRGRIEDELGLPVLLLHGVVMTHHNGSVRFAVRRHTQPEQAKIDAKRENGRSKDEDDHAEKDSSQQFSEFRRCQRHEARL